MRTTIGLLMALVAADGFAQSEKLFAAPATQSAAASPGGSMLQTTLSLLVVLLAVFAAAYLMRRLRKFGGASAAHGIDVIAQVALGSKERAVLLKVAGAHVLVGVTPTNVNCLHVLDANAIPSAPVDLADAARRNDDATAPTFKSLLKKSLGMGQ